MRAALPALAALAFLPACREAAPQVATPEPPRPVQVAEIRFAPAEQPRAFAGVVKARREADIAFRAGGRIAARLVDVGASVTAGQELARLDPADIALSVRSAEADLAAAEAEARRAVADAGRSRTLMAAGHVAAAFDDQRQATARSAEERVAAARAALNLARNRLDHTILRAPSDGVVTAVLAESGQVMAEGQPVLRIADPPSANCWCRCPRARCRASPPRPRRRCFGHGRANLSPPRCARSHPRPTRCFAPMPRGSACPRYRPGPRSA